MERENQDFGEQRSIKNLFQVSRLKGIQISESFGESGKEIGRKILVGEAIKIEANPSLVNLDSKTGLVADWQHCFKKYTFFTFL